jgi:Tol biopolymer transport system component
MLSPGTSLGPYEVVAQIGAGGMGEVYRARDTDLGRDVAIKVLPAAYSADPDRLRRFEQEARAVGALNHPNVLAVYGFGKHDSAPYVVSELLDGETLRDRLAAGAIPSRKAIDYSLQIAQGLAAAHEKGVVHRDLKPENVFVTRDGRVKLLDFGLAKLTHANGKNDTSVPTMTEPGVVMGTVGYMSPEQARGLAADHRTDIFSFGTVLYEMLSGTKAFTGGSAVETLNAILTRDPPELASSGAVVSPALDRILRHCLEKSPEERFQSARDLAFDLQTVAAITGETSTQPTVAGRGAPVARRRWSRLVALQVAFAAGALAFWALSLRRPKGVAPVTRFFISAPEDSRFAPTDRGGVAVSPDGRRIVFVAEGPNGMKSLWLQSLDSLAAEEIPGTRSRGSFMPFWSPDGRSIAFFAENKLMKLDLSGAPPQPLCEVQLGRGGTWGPDGTIVFAPAVAGPLFRVASGGGTPVPLTSLDTSRGETSHRWPSFLPDGRHVLFLAWSVPRTNTILSFVSLDTKERTQLIGAQSNALCASGHLLFARGSSLVARPFDAKRLRFGGDPVTVASGIDDSYVIASAHAAFSAAKGTLAFASGERGATEERAQLLWFDRGGKRVAVASPPDGYRDPALAPDGTRIAANRRDPATGLWALWLVDAKGSPTRLSFDRASSYLPVFSPDGRQVVFASDRGTGTFQLYVKPVAGGNDEPISRSSHVNHPMDWSPDGRTIVYEDVDPSTKRDLWLLSLSDRKATPYLKTQADEYQAQFSPDGKWMAYASDESGSSEVYVQPIPPSGAKWQVSSSGGTQPRWRRDGKELFYLSAVDVIMAAPVSVSGASFSAGAPSPLFKVKLGCCNGGGTDEFVPSADGQRFLVATVEEGHPVRIAVVLNWDAQLGR